MCCIAARQAVAVGVLDRVEGKLNPSDLGTGLEHSIYRKAIGIDERAVGKFCEANFLKKMFEDTERTAVPPAICTR